MTPDELTQLARDVVARRMNCGSLVTDMIRDGRWDNSPEMSLACEVARAVASAVNADLAGKIEWLRAENAKQYERGKRMGLEEAVALLDRMAAKNRSEAFSMRMHDDWNMYNAFASAQEVASGDLRALIDRA